MTVNDGEADEGDTITFTVTLDKAVQGGLTVTPSFTSGTAADADYTANTAALTFTGTADETQTFKVATVEDAVVEADETFTVGLAVSKAPSGITSTDTGEGTIENDDAAAVTVNDADADEGDTITFTVTLDKAVQGGLTVTPGYTNGTAVWTDYTANRTALTFTGTADETKTFKVATVEDAVFEADETFTVGLTVSKAPSGITSTDTGAGTIDNDDAAAVTVNDGEADEGDTITFTVTLDNAVQGGLTVTPSFTSGTAAAADYTANTAALTFTGTADETKTFKVATVEDAVFEADETFTVGLTVSKAPSGITSTDTGTGTIENDESAAVTVNDADADEGDTITFTVTLDNAVQGGLTVTPSFTSGTAADTDYTANTAALTFAGTADETKTFKVATVEDAVFEADETFTVGLTVSKAPSGITSTDTGTGTIDNDESAAVTVNDASEDEGDTITFTVTLDNAVQGGLTVTPGYTNGTAATGDYTANTAALTFAGTASETKTFKVATVEDAVFEADETFTVGLTVSKAPSGITSTDTGTGTIDNDESAAVTVNDASEDEGDTITFTVTLDNAVQGGLTVTPGYTNGTAATGDYTANTAALTFAGTASETKTFKVATVEDAVFEADETFTVGLTVSKAPSGITSTDTGTGTIDNDESAAVTIADAEAEEGDTITFTVTLDNAVQGGLTVTPGYTNGTAADADYTANTAALTFAGDGESERKTFKVATVEDAVLEADETFTVSLTVTNAPSGVTSTDTGDGTIENDESATLSIGDGGGTPGDASAEEGDSIEFTVTLDNAVQGGLTVTPGYTNGTAASGDYTANTAALAFAGTADETKTFKVATVEDVVFEADETFTVELSVSDAPSGVTTSGTRTGTIANDETAEVTINDVGVDEGDSIEFTVTLDNAVQGGLTVTPGYTDGTTSSTDYTANTAALAFAGTADETKTFKVATVEDVVFEADETFTVGLSVSDAPSGLTDTDTGTGVIWNDDTHPDVDLSVTPARVSEDAGATEVEVTAALSRGDTVSMDIVVTVAVGDSLANPSDAGAATPGTDYEKVSEFDIVIPSGTLGGTGTFTLTPIQDSTVEGDEAIWVTGRWSTGMEVGGAEVTLTDDDADPAVYLSVDPASVDEEASATEVTVTAKFSSSSTFPTDTTVVVSVGGGTATAGTDYAAVADFRVTISAGETSGTGTFTLVPEDDKLVEGDETIGVSGAAVGLRVRSTEVELTDYDEVLEVNLSVDTASVGEGASATEVTVTAAFWDGYAFPVDTAVTVSVGDGTATAGADYAAVADFRVTISAGETSGTGTFTLAPEDDNVVEGDETIGVSGSAAGLAVDGTEVSLVDDDEVPEVVLSVDPESVGEGAGATAVTVTVALANGGAFPVDTAVTVSVGGGTATAGADYAAVADFRVTISAGETSGTATFTLVPEDDNVVEADETIGVSGSVAGLAVHGTEVELADDDEVPEVVLSAGPESVDERASAGVVTVTAEFSNGDAFPEDTAVTVSVGGGTATVGADYEAVADFRVTISAGETSGTATFTLVPEDDNVVEADETIGVSGAAAGLVVHDTEVSLADDDEVPAVVLSVDPASVGEGAGATAVTVTVALADGGTFPVDTTVDGERGRRHGDGGCGLRGGGGLPSHDFGGRDERDGDVHAGARGRQRGRGGRDDRGVGCGCGAWSSTAEVSLADDDEVPAVVLSVDPASVGEGAGATAVTVTVALADGGTFPVDTTVDGERGRRHGDGGCGLRGGGGLPSHDFGGRDERDQDLHAHADSGLDGGGGRDDRGVGQRGGARGRRYGGGSDGQRRSFRGGSERGSGERGRGRLGDGGDGDGGALERQRLPYGHGGDGERGRRHGDGGCGLRGGGGLPSHDFGGRDERDGDLHAGARGRQRGRGGRDDRRVGQRGGARGRRYGGEPGRRRRGSGGGSERGSGECGRGCGCDGGDVDGGAGGRRHLPSGHGGDGERGRRHGDGGCGLRGGGGLPSHDFGGRDERDGDVHAGARGRQRGRGGRDDRRVGCGCGPGRPRCGGWSDGRRRGSGGGSERGSGERGRGGLGERGDGDGGALERQRLPRGHGGDGKRGRRHGDGGCGLRGGGGLPSHDFGGRDERDGDLHAGARGRQRGRGGRDDRRVGCGCGLGRPRCGGWSDGRRRGSGGGSERGSGERGRGASASVVTLTAALSNGSAFPEDTAVTVSVGGGTATAGADYAAVADFRVTISAGETSGTATFTLAPEDDNVVEADETIGVSGAAAGLVVHDAEVGLTDDDEVPEVVLSVDPASVGEGAGATAVTLTAVLSNGSAFPEDTAVEVSVGGGTATAGEDYAAVADFRVTISAGETSGTATFTLAPEDDNVVEADETIGVSGAAAGLVVHDAEVGLTDDDEVPEVVLSVDPASVGEGASASVVTVTAELSNGSAFPVDTAVTVSVGGGTATAGADYAAVADFRVTISAGETSGTATFTLAPEDDNVVEADETIGVSGAAAGLVVHDTEMTLTDDEEIPEVVLSVDPVRVVESAPAKQVAVTAALSNGNTFPEDATVTVTMGGGTATAGVDYAEVKEFEIEISAGETSGAGTFTLAPKDDNLVEGDETIELSGAVLGGMVAGGGNPGGVLVTRATITLADDDRVAKRTRVLELGLARIARTVATQAVDAIGARFEAASRISGSGGGLAVDPFAVAGIIEAGRGGPGVRLSHAREWGAGGPVDGPMGGPGFGGGGFGGGGLLALALGGEGSEAGHWTLWASGATTGFSGRADGFEMDGGVNSAYVGVDRRLGSNAVVGVAVSRNQGGMDAEETESEWSGDLDTRMTTVYPYLRWSPGGKIDLWGMVGVGRGDVELDDGAEPLLTDGGLRMAAIGLRSDMARVGPVGLAVRADAFAAGMTADEVKDKAGAADGSAQRARLMLDGSADLALSPHSRLTPSVEVGARADGGDAETGPGMELGGGLAYANSRLGLEIGARGRWLALHGDEDFGEWGGTMSVRRLPTNPGRGLSVSLESGWGEDASGVAALWEGRGTVGGGFGSRGWSGEAASTWRPDLVEMEVAYGTGLPAALGSLRPFGQVRMAGAGSRDVRVGTRLDLAGEDEGGGLRLELRGEQRSAAGGAPSYGAGLSLAVADLRTSGGLLAPFGEFDFDGASGQRLAVGTRWQLFGGGDNRPGWFGIELLGEALKGANDARSKYGLVLRGSSGLGTR